jgi:HD-GYP domain-containing protein (c-di-GMP phosphodiesterase class II)
MIDSIETSYLQTVMAPYKARIINVADSWDAMTTDRAYRRALSRESAIRELVRCAGKQFDGDIVEVFVTSVVQGEGA